MATSAIQQMAAQMQAMQNQQSMDLSGNQKVPTDITLTTQEDTSSKGGTAILTIGTSSGGCILKRTHKDTPKPPPNNNTKMRHGKLMWQKPHYCKHCKKEVFHFEKDCQTLLKNNAKEAGEKKA